jgi:hypothetical protein
MKAYLAKRDALFLNPTSDGAYQLMLESAGADHINLARPDVPMAGLHRARLQWIDATDAMIEESMAWLKAHGYSTHFKGAAPPLTPKSRDAQRAARGLPPLTGL